MSFLDKIFSKGPKPIIAESRSQDLSILKSANKPQRPGMVATKDEYYVTASVELGNTTTKCVIMATNLNNSESYLINKTVNMTRDVRKPKAGEEVFGKTVWGIELSKESVAEMIKDTVLESLKKAHVDMDEDLDFVVRSTGVTAGFATTEEVGAKGLAWTKFEQDGTVQGGIAKFITEEAKALADEREIEYEDWHTKGHILNLFSSRFYIFSYYFPFIQMDFFVSYDLIILMSLTCKQNHIAGLMPIYCILNCFYSVANNTVRRFRMSHTHNYLINNALRLLCTGVIACDYNIIGIFSGNSSHYRALCPVSVASAAKHNHKPSVIVTTERLQRIFQRIRGMSVVNENSVISIRRNYLHTTFNTRCGFQCVGARRKVKIHRKTNSHYTKGVINAEFSGYGKKYINIFTLVFRLKAYA